MAHVLIETTTMGFRVGVSKRGTILGTGVFIGEYVRKLEHKQYDATLRQTVLVNEYFYFDEENEICYFPKYDLDRFLSFLSDNRVSYTIKEIEGVGGKHVNFMMLPWVSYKNDKQENAVKFLTNPESGPLRGLALQTGAGKTVSYIWTLQKLHRRSMTTMTSRLEQWVGEATKYTTLEEDDIYVISGVGSLTKLFNQIDKEVHPKLILASTQTIKRYMEYGPNYQHLPHPSEMCEKLGIGIIGTDEYHEHFHTNFLIMTVMNPHLFIPITATFIANDPFVKNVFNSFIPKAIQFTGGEYDKFVNVTAYKYTSGGYLVKPYHYTARKVYSQIKFEDFLLSKKGRPFFDPMVNEAIIPIVREHYINVAEENEKFLMLCATKAMCDEFASLFKRRFQNKKVSVFYSGMPNHILEKSDMIISTPGSAGTGRDIKGLRTCFVFDNTASEIRNLQYIGRLRGPPQMMNEPEFNYIAFSCIPQHEKYYQQRAMLYGPRAKSFKHRTIS